PARARRNGTAEPAWPGTRSSIVPPELGFTADGPPHKDQQRQRPPTDVQPALQSGRATVLPPCDWGVSYPLSRKSPGVHITFVDATPMPIFGAAWRGAARADWVVLSPRHQGRPRRGGEVIRL